MILQYEFTPFTWDDNDFHDEVEWEYQINGKDIGEFLLSEYTPKYFADILYDNDYLTNNADDIEYWSETFNTNFSNAEEIRDYIASMNSMSDVLYYFDVDEQNFDEVIYNDDDLYQEVLDYFEDRAREDFEDNYDPDAGHLDFEDNGAFYRYKEGPDYWRK